MAKLKQQKKRSESPILFDEGFAILQEMPLHEREMLLKISGPSCDGDVDCFEAAYQIGVNEALQSNQPVTVFIS